MSCHLSTVPDFSTTSPATQLEKLSTTVALTRTSTHTVTKNMINALLQAFGKQVGANKQASLQLLYALAAKEGISATRGGTMMRGVRRRGARRVWRRRSPRQRRQLVWVSTCLTSGRESVRFRVRMKSWESW
jgi:hypothetical protein